MRNLDLDQYWPLPPRRAEESARDSGAGNASLPPALPSAEILAAASAGWQDTGVIERPVAVALDAAVRNANAAAMAPVAQTSLPPAVPLLEPAADALPAPTLTPAPRANHDPAAAPEELATSARTYLTPLIWGGSGFIAGMLAWHAVGFWTFVSNVVLNANDPRAQALEAPLPKLAQPHVMKAIAPVTGVGKSVAQPAAKPPADAPKSKQACVALTLDRGKGGTNITACAEGVAGLRDAGFNKRSDKLALKPRLQDPVAWTGTTAVQVTEAEQTEAEVTPPESGTLSESDLRLDLPAEALNIGH